MSEKVVIGVDGGTEGLRVGVFSLSGEELSFASAPYPTDFPAPGRAEQNPEDWWRALHAAVPEALAKSGRRKDDILALAVDTTCCTVCFLDHDKKPLRPALLWMDVRADKQAGEVLTTGDRALAVNNAGHGPVSAEWMIPKAMWVKQNEPQNYERASVICEYQDYLNYRLTGLMTASANNTGVRWHFRHDADGAPMAMLAALNMEELAEKWPPTIVSPGAVIGGLSSSAAQDLSLRPGLPVVQGGADAFIAMAGMGVVHPGELALVTGSSHLHLAVTKTPLHNRGMWGAYADILQPGAYVVEGGQTSTGSIVNWFRRTLAPEASYSTLDQEAAQIPIGCDGVIAQDHFQGNRTPHTDALSRGAFVGLSLKHSRGHLYRALLESVAFGTRLIIDTMTQNGVNIDSITACGGVTRSPLWTQIHADAIGKPLRIADADCAPALGCAIFAAIGVGVYHTLDEAAANMTRIRSVIEPNEDVSAQYENAYRQYKALYDAASQVRRVHNDD